MQMAETPINSQALSSISSNWIRGRVVTPLIGETWKLGMQFRSPPPVPNFNKQMTFQIAESANQCWSAIGNFTTS
jgi:hypothetical protein